MTRFLCIALLALFGAYVAPANPLMVIAGSPPVVASGVEGFELTGPPSGWSDTSPSTAANYDSTSPALTDAQSLLITDPGTGANVASATLDFTDADTVYIGFRVQFSALIASSSGSWFVVRDQAGTTMATVDWRNTDNTMTCIATGGTVSSATSTAFAATTEYVFKVQFTKGTGANATIVLSWSTDGTNWVSTRSSTNGTSTNQPGKAEWRTRGDHDMNVSVDSVLYSTSDFAPTAIP